MIYPPAAAVAGTICVHYMSYDVVCSRLVSMLMLSLLPFFFHDLFIAHRDVKWRAHFGSAEPEDGFGFEHAQKRFDSVVP